MNRTLFRLALVVFLTGCSVGTESRELAKKVESIGPTLESQSFVVGDDGLLAFTDYLVYPQKSKPILYVRMMEPFTVSIESFQNRTSKQSFRGGFGKRQPINFNTFSGFDLLHFKSISLNVDAHDGWVQIIVKSAKHVVNIPIFIEKKPTNSVLFVESTDTLKAYNSGFGMRSNYLNPSQLKGDFSRPFGYPMDYKIARWGPRARNIACKDHLINADLVLKDGLNRIGVTHSAVSDEFFDGTADLMKFRMIVLGAHNEYWTSMKLEKLKRYVESGGSLLILGANTAYRWVTRHDGFDSFWGDGVLRTDPLYLPFLKTILGSYYDSAGFGTYAPFKLIDGAGLISEKFLQNQEFGLNSVFEECAEVVGASGHETDKLLSDHDGFTLIAKGTNIGGGGGDIVFKSFESGGQVLNFGSIALWHNINDPIIEKLIKSFSDKSKK